eukprot:m.104846 g.104846  ORF g.104846 m.104846 type:complete len:55 (+) comp27597_c0_seq2:125-289(+)
MLLWLRDEQMCGPCEEQLRSKVQRLSPHFVNERWFMKPVESDCPVREVEHNSAN